MSKPDLMRQIGGRVLGWFGAESSPDNGMVPKNTPGPTGLNDSAAHAIGRAPVVKVGHASFEERQRRHTEYWEGFGDIVRDYLGIPYKKDGRAVPKHTGMPAGIATREAGLVCTSFVDVVLSRYVRGDARRQLKSYSFGERSDIFDKYGLNQLATDVEPTDLDSLDLDTGRVYGVVFHMKNEWVKKTKKRGPQKRKAGSRIHVGFLAFHRSKPFLIHASGSKGVHVMAWHRFLTRFGSDLEKFGGAALKGSKFLSVYRMPRNT